MMLIFSKNPAVGNCLLSIPGKRNHKKFSEKETLAESGIYTKENYINIGEKVEIKPIYRSSVEEKIMETKQVLDNFLRSIIIGARDSVIDDTRLVLSGKSKDLISSILYKKLSESFQ